jgi:hypothetical protein
VHYGDGDHLASLLSVVLTPQMNSSVSDPSPIYTGMSHVRAHLLVNLMNDTDLTQHD